MSRPMKPELARNLLKAASENNTDLHPLFRESLETIAAMREEWGVESREHFGGMVTDWHLAIPFHKGRNRESAKAFIEGRKDNPGFEYRLVLRYVTQCEVIDGE